jgi:Tol biopolymer transport system component
MRAVKGGDKDGVTMIHLDGERVLLGQNCGRANQGCVVGTISPDGKTITFNSEEATKLVGSQEGHTKVVVFKLVGSDDQPLEFITTAARQIHQALGLMR